jgi:hypothetical protein
LIAFGAYVFRCDRRSSTFPLSGLSIGGIETRQIVCLVDKSLCGWPLSLCCCKDSGIDFVFTNEINYAICRLVNKNQINLTYGTFILIVPNIFIGRKESANVIANIEYTKGLAAAVNVVFLLVIVGEVTALFSVSFLRGLELVFLLCPQARVLSAAVPEFVLFRKKIDHVIEC